MPRYSVILGNLGNTRDRFCDAYKVQPPKAEMVRQAASIAGVEGIELVGGWDITVANVREIRGLLGDHGLRCSSIIPDHFTKASWGLGAFTSRDPAIRREAVAATTAMMDAAAELGCDLVNLWPGQDGFDYPLQADHDRAWEWMVDGVRRAARHRPDVRLALEYKIREPRTHVLLSRAAETLLVALETGRPNVGVCIDVGHSLMAAENPSEAASLLMRHGRLFHMHFNDNYRGWDDDMIVGTLHLAEYVELAYWLRRGGYQGWWSMDQYPYREDARGALDASIRFLDGMWQRIKEIGWSRIGDAIEQGDPVAAAALLRSLIGFDRPYARVTPAAAER